MATEVVRVAKAEAQAKELFPAASELFDVLPGKKRSRIPLFAWLIAAAVVILAGQRVVYWLDRNL